MQVGTLIEVVEFNPSDTLPETGKLNAELLGILAMQTSLVSWDNQ